MIFVSNKVYFSKKYIRFFLWFLPRKHSAHAVIEIFFLKKLDIIVRPISGPAAPQDLMLVVFKELGSLKPPKAASKKKSDMAAGESGTALLEDELRFTRETLQTTIEQLETSNEELKSTNEELQSTNEELQSTNEEMETSKEELQSLNEESSTVNAELQSRIDELSKADRVLYERARKMQNFLTQPMFVAESFTGRKGQFVKVDDTLDSVEKIVDGRKDDASEEEFYMIGKVE